jgi:hypothetical protein
MLVASSYDSSMYRNFIYHILFLLTGTVILKRLSGFG